MNVKRRDLIGIAFLIVFTLGFYIFYWAYKTKQELIELGGTIPTVLNLIFPFCHLYFWYRYAENYSTLILKKDKTITYFFLAILPFMVQTILLFIKLPEAISFFNIFKGKEYFDFILKYWLPLLQIYFIPIMIFQIGFNKIASSQNINANLTEN